MARKPRKQSDEAFNGAEPAKFDHDQDGAPGGSKKRVIGALELDAIRQEAWEAYDYQQERIRFDTLNRKWIFRLGKAGVYSVLEMSIERLAEVHTDTISTAFLASDLGRPMIADVVDKLNKALA